MNYNYQQPGDEQQQPRHHGYQIVVPWGPPPQQPPPDQDPYALKPSPQQMNEIHLLRMRQGHANVRSQEQRIIMNAMEQIKSALDGQALTVGEGDNGATARPPLTPSFDDVNRGRLQHAYLYLAERLTNYVDFMLTQELKIPVTNDINKQKAKADGVHE